MRQRIERSDQLLLFAPLAFRHENRALTRSVESLFDELGILVELAARLHEPARPIHIFGIARSQERRHHDERRDKGERNAQAHAPLRELVERGQELAMRRSLQQLFRKQDHDGQDEQHRKEAKHDAFRQHHAHIRADEKRHRAEGEESEERGRSRRSDDTRSLVHTRECGIVGRAAPLA